MTEQKHPPRTGIDHKRAEQAEIEHLTQEFLKRGNRIDEIPSFEKSGYSPAFNRGPEGFADE